MRDTLNGLEEKRNVQCFSDIREKGEVEEAVVGEICFKKSVGPLVNFIRLNKS